MNKPGIELFISSLIIIAACSCSSRLIPEKPNLTVADFNLDSLPDSEINIPIQVSLQPLYQLAEKNIDTVFTSPRYPDEWVQDGCDIRYKYFFRRGPLAMQSSGLYQNIGFTGFYKIIGSTRICSDKTALSPWTPPCRCGFSEGERKVKVSFSSSVVIQPDYKTRIKLHRKEPEPLDKCEVCFWGLDITRQVMQGLKAELDLAKKEIEKTFGVVDLKPKFQQLWNELNKAYPLYSLGWLKINPQKLKLTGVTFRNDSLHVQMGLSAKPRVSFEKPAEIFTLVPDIGDTVHQGGFNVFLDAVLNYDSLSAILNHALQGKKFELDNGLIKKTFKIKSCSLYGVGNENLIIRIDFSGSNTGRLYLTGRPAYNASDEILEIKNIGFDIRTKNLLLKTAGWLLNNKIIQELSPYTRYDLSAYFAAARAAASKQINREWTQGILSEGSITHMDLSGIYPLANHLIIRSNCSGYLSVKTGNINFSF